MDKIKELYNIDIKENFIKHLDDALLSILLKDRSSGKNLIWATDTYVSHGVGFGSRDYITQAQITGKRGGIIKPRTEKSKKEQQTIYKNEVATVRKFRTVASDRTRLGKKLCTLKRCVKNIIIKLKCRSVFKRAAY